MDPAKIRAILEAVRDGTADVDAALGALRDLPFADVDGVARVDHHRPLRCGVPEVVFCQGKRPDDVGRIAAEILAHGAGLLATRADSAALDAVRAVAPAARWEERARCIVVDPERPLEREGLVLVVSAGTSDIPVAEEARVTAEAFGSRVRTLYDVGVAGLHRLLAHRPLLDEANALVVVAGMEGALASVVGGLAARPVIAVPTSVGYGASFGGLAALLTMLNSCAAGVAVVNIDNGFGAGTIAHRINRSIVAAAGR
jgi:NCAIR mutase (PurE)-related protein